MVNGSNSASKYTIETPHGESEPIGCSAGYVMERYPSGEGSDLLNRQAK